METERLETDDLMTNNSIHFRRGTLSKASLISLTNSKGRGSILPPISSRNTIVEEGKGRSKSVGKFNFVKGSRF